MHGGPAISLPCNSWVPMPSAADPNSARGQAIDFCDRFSPAPFTISGRHALTLAQPARPKERWPAKQQDIAERPRFPGRNTMSAVGVDTGIDFAAAASGPNEISRRLESLPASAYLWRLVILLSLGGCFEIYDLFLTGYIAPGLNRSGLLTTTTQAFFGFSGIGAFVAATFAGLFVGTFFLGFLADRFGRRAIFTFALLGYTAASVVMACQTSSGGLLLWRFIAGIGIGVEVITIDA